MKYKCISIPLNYVYTGDGQKLVGFGQYVSIGQIYILEKSIGMRGTIWYDVKVITPDEIYTTTYVTTSEFKEHFKSIRDINLENLIYET